MAFGVGKLFDLLDLQAAIVVGNYLCDEDRLAVHVDPECGFRLAGVL